MPTARRTYLEMRDPAALTPGQVPQGDVRLQLEAPCAPAFYRTLYLGVGEPYRWTDRAAWTNEEIIVHLATPGLEVWTLRVNGEVAGYFELHPCSDGSVEIAYLGLLPAFVGRKLGGQLCTAAARRAWALDPVRVWLHTCTFDHPHALANYLNRGFAVTRIEEYEVE